MAVPTATLNASGRPLHRLRRSPSPVRFATGEDVPALFFALWMVASEFESKEAGVKGRYPRTVGEFAANQRQVWVGCSECNRRRLVPNDVLDALFGPDFDLYDGFAALEAELRCETCGKKHRLIIFHDATEYPFNGDVSYEESVTRELERRAYWQLRDRNKPQPMKGARRRG